MGQWDPELRASAEARQAGKQASKQKARRSSDWQRQGTDEAARRTPKMVLWEEGEEQKKSVEIRGCEVTKGEPRILGVSRCSSALKRKLTLFAPPGPRLHWQAVGALDTRRRARHVGSCRRQRSLRLSAES